MWTEHITEDCINSNSAMMASFGCGVSFVEHLCSDSQIRYDTVKEYNVDSKAECDQLNLAHETNTNRRQCP